MKPTSSSLGLILAVVGLALPGCRFWAGKSENTISLSGNIELTEVELAFSFPGRLVELTLEEGTAVQKGAVVARLDTDQIQRQLERERAGVAVAQSQLRQHETVIAHQQALLSAERGLRQAELRHSQARLQEIMAGPREQELGEASAAVEEARTQLQQAQRDWERAQVLYKNDDISTAQRDQFQARYESSASALKRTEERFSLIKEGARKEEIEAARAQVARAEAAVRLSEAGSLEVQRREQELTARRAEIDRARAQAAVLEEQLKDAVAVAPIAGIVLVKSAQQGEVLAAGTPFATLGDLDHPWLRGYISERDLGRVKQGAKVRVTTDSFPGKVYWGRITFIASEAEFTPRQIQTPEERAKLVYRIKVELDNPNHELKLNMPADAVIELP